MFMKVILHGIKINKDRSGGGVCEAFNNKLKVCVQYSAEGQAECKPELCIITLSNQLTSKIPHITQNPSL